MKVTDLATFVSCTAQTYFGLEVPIELHGESNISEAFGLYTWSLQHVFSFGTSNRTRFKQHHGHRSSMLVLMARVCGQLGTLRCGFLISWRRRSCRVRQVTSKILWRRVPSQRVYSGSTWLQRVYACRPCESDISHAGSQTTSPRGPFCGFAPPRLVYTLSLLAHLQWTTSGTWDDLCDIGRPTILSAGARASTSVGNLISFSEGLWEINPKVLQPPATLSPPHRQALPAF